MKTTATTSETLIFQLRAERAALEPALAVDLDVLEAAHMAAYREEQDYLASPGRQGHSNAPDVRAIELSAATSATREALTVAGAAKQAAERRIPQLSALIDADDNAKAAAVAAAQARADGQACEKLIDQVRGASEKLEGEIRDLEQKARDRADEAAQRALNGEVVVLKSDDTAAQIAARQAAVTGLARRREALVQSLADIAERAAGARRNLLLARRAQAQLAWDAAVADLMPLAARLAAASRTTDGAYGPNFTIDVRDDAIAREVEAILADAQAWVPTLRAVPVESGDPLPDGANDAAGAATEQQAEAA